MRTVSMYLLVLLVLAFVALGAAQAQTGGQLQGPDKPRNIPSWLANLQNWRDEYHNRMGYDGSRYARPELQWIQSNFVQALMMVQDRYFFDPAGGRYTVDRYLDDLEKRYGGIDSVVVWHHYPNWGLDDRNHLEMLRDMPGGVTGLRQMVADFHRRGVRVLFPVEPFDLGTHKLDQPVWEAATKLVAEIGGDGLFGDTFEGLPEAFRRASDRIGLPLVFEPEGFPVDEAIAWNNLSWGQEWTYGFIPSVARQKWLEPRHMIHIANRNAHDHRDDLQQAFFNGTGFESWENVFGLYNQMTPRDGEALRRISLIERTLAPLLRSPDWEPHTPTLQFGIYASKFPEHEETMWTLVNRNEYRVTGAILRVKSQTRARYFDLWHGVELKPEIHGNDVTLSLDIEQYGYGAVLATSKPASEDVKKLLDRMSQLVVRPVEVFSAQWKFLPQHLADIAPTQPLRATPPGMVRVPGGTFEFSVLGLQIEGGSGQDCLSESPCWGNASGGDVQYPWEDTPRRYHLKTITMKPFYIDQYPVTNSDFKKFLDKTHYWPKDDHNFLKHWKRGTFPDGWAKKPVTWISGEDARAYAAWAGKRLPHEWEWQYSAQGGDGRVYPWGNEWNATAVPDPDHGRNMRAPDDVDAHPKGASPFGVMDLVGNVWQWTDEFADEHTRSVVLRGGSYYQPRGTFWYLPQAYRTGEHQKYLLLSPGYDRAGAVGFRCIADAAE